MKEQQGRDRTLGQETSHNDGTPRASVKRRSQEKHIDNGRATKSAKTQNHSSSRREEEDDAHPGATERRQFHGAIVNSKPQVQIPVRKSKNVDSVTKTTLTTQPEPVTESIEDAEPVQSTSGKRTRPRTNATTKGTGNSSQNTANGPGQSSLFVSESEAEEDEEETSMHDNEEVEEQARRTAKYPTGTIEHVLEFLDLDERDGGCQTRLGISIHSVCERSDAHLRDSDITIEEVVRDINDVRGELKRVSKAEEHDHRALKEDMYGYVFRSLASVLQSLYDCLKELYGDLLHSLHAMRIVVRFMHDILSLKQTIAGWKTKIHQRYQGDRIIRDIDSHLIAPLREVQKIFIKRLSQLENRESNRRRVERMRREAVREEEGRRREEEADTARRERWKVWQDLHTTRMRCETSPRRKQNLVIPEFTMKPEDTQALKERDANGDEFVRVPLFGQRSTPKLRLAYQRAKDTQWSDEQATALLDGLKDYAGRPPYGVKRMLMLTGLSGPNVYHKIFRAHCRVGGSLRGFTVADILVKVEWICDTLKLQQQSGIEAPAWFERMPPFPWYSP